MACLFVGAVGVVSRSNPAKVIKPVVSTEGTNLPGRVNKNTRRTQYVSSTQEGALRRKATALNALEDYVSKSRAFPYGDVFLGAPIIRPPPHRSSYALFPMQLPKPAVLCLALDRRASRVCLGTSDGKVVAVSWGFLATNVMVLVLVLVVGVSWVTSFALAIQWKLTPGSTLVLAACRSRAWV